MKDEREDIDIKSIDKENRVVYFTDGTSVDYPSFVERFRLFLQGRIAGETLYPADMERFMRRTSGKNLSQLMKGKKMEGYFEGVSDKLLTPRQKIAVGVIITIVFVVMIVLYMGRSMFM